MSTPAPLLVINWSALSQGGVNRENAAAHPVKAAALRALLDDFEGVSEQWLECGLAFHTDEARVCTDMVRQGYHHEPSAFCYQGVLLLMSFVLMFLFKDFFMFIK